MARSGATASNSATLWRKVRRGGLGILAGIAAGTVLAVAVESGPVAVGHDLARVFIAAYHYVTTGRALLVEPFSYFISSLAWQTAIVWSVLIAAAAVPLWMALGRFGRSRWIHALLLGAVLGGAVGAVFEADQILNILNMLKIAGVGAAAGLVTWIVAHRTSKAPAAAG